MFGGPGVKIPRIFGRQIVEAGYISKRQKTMNEIPIQFVLGHGDCEIYSQDWSKCYHSFPVSESKVHREQDDLLHFSYSKQGQQGQQAQQVDFFLKYERHELILSAWTGPGEKRQAESAGSMTAVDWPEVVQFACGLPVGPQGQTPFRPYLEAQARKRVLFLACSGDISESLLTAIAIEFKMRFPQIEQDNWTEAFEVLWFEFIGFVVSLWTQCLKSAIEPHTGPNSFEYFRRLTASIAGLIAKGADVFQVDRREFLIAVRKYLEQGDPSDIPTASRAIVNDVELALGNVRKRWLLQLTDLFEFTQLFSAAIAIGQGTVKDNKEVKAVANMLSSWALSLVNNLVKGPRMVDFRNGVEKLAVSVLQEMDKKRYQPEFHCTLALWKLSELVKASD
jgi:hypothetical protein